MLPEKQIRAQYNDDTITVYQAYRSEIGVAAVQNQRFVSPFKMDRMTWIKPSFLWMMYRAGWATKEGQEHILAVQIKREGFEWALQNSCSSHYDAQIHSSHEAWNAQLHQSPVRIQWDPEKDIHMRNLPHRSIQIGLSGVAVRNYVSDWTVRIDDITPLCREIHRLVRENQIDLAAGMLPVERPYPLAVGLGARIGQSVFLGDG